MVSEITHSSAQQSSAMQVMAQGVEQVANLTGENLAIAQKTSEVSAALQRSVDKMHKAAQQYRI
jgi:aerotaxis receptor